MTGTNTCNQEDYEQFFRLSLDMLTVVAKGGIALRASDAWRTTLGYDPAQVVGRNVFNLVHPEDLEETVREARRAENGARLAQVRSRMKAKSGAYRWMDWSISPGANGEVMYCVARDVTDIKRQQDNEAMLIEALEASTIALQETVTELDRTRAEAEYLANHDTLTGLLNRRAWIDQVTVYPPGSLAVLDVDHFKRVNDQLGHPAGDDVLASIGALIARATSGTSSLAGRLGGEEFAIALYENVDTSMEVVREILHTIRSTPVITRAGVVHVSASAGMAGWRATELPFCSTYDDADAALYDAKRSGRDRVVIARPLVA